MGPGVLDESEGPIPEFDNQADSEHTPGRQIVSTPTQSAVGAVPAHLLSLQRLAGNRAVQSMLRAGPRPAPIFLQRDDVVEDQDDPGDLVDGVDEIDEGVEAMDIGGDDGGAGGDEERAPRNPFALDFPPPSSSSGSSLGGFGSPSSSGGFGPPSGGFGSSSPFGGFGGPSSGGFGGLSPSSGLFGAPSSSGGFGSTPPSPWWSSSSLSGGFGSPPPSPWSPPPSPFGSSGSSPFGAGAPSPSPFGLPMSSPSPFGAPSFGFQFGQTAPFSPPAQQQSGPFPIFGSGSAGSGPMYSFSSPPPGEWGKDVQKSEDETVVQRAAMVGPITVQRIGAGKVKNVVGTDGIARRFTTGPGGYVEFAAPLIPGDGPALVVHQDVQIMDAANPTKLLLQPAYQYANVVRRPPLKNTHGWHFMAANWAAFGTTGKGSPAPNTWHHHKDKGRMQLIDASVHGVIPHNGGHSTWGKK